MLRLAAALFCAIAVMASVPALAQDLTVTSCANPRDCKSRGVSRDCAVRRMIPGRCYTDPARGGFSMVVGSCGSQQTICVNASAFDSASCAGGSAVELNAPCVACAPLGLKGGNPRFMQFDCGGLPPPAQYFLSDCSAGCGSCKTTILDTGKCHSVPGLGAELAYGKIAGFTQCKTVNVTMWVGKDCSGSPTQFLAPVGSCFNGLKIDCK